MQRLPMVPEGGGDRGGESAGDDAQEVRQATRGGHPLAAECHRAVCASMATKKVPMPDAEHQLRQHEGDEARVGGEAGTHEIGHRECREANRDQQPAGIDAARSAARPAARARPPPRRRARRPDLPRWRCSRPASAATAAAARYCRRTPHSRGSRRSCPEQKLRRVNSDRSTIGLRSVQLPDEPGDEGDHRHDRKRHDRGRAEPVQILALIEHDLQRADPERSAGPKPTVSIGSRRVGVSRLLRKRAQIRPENTPTGTLM